MGDTAKQAESGKAAQNPETVVLINDVDRKDTDTPDTNDTSGFPRNFSWTKDDSSDEENSNFTEEKETVVSKCLMHVRSLPFLLRYILYSVFGSAFIMTPGLISYFLFIGI